MICEYCGNKSGKLDSRGMCVSCNAPISIQEYAPKLEPVSEDLSEYAHLVGRKVKSNESWESCKTPWSKENFGDVGIIQSVFRQAAVKIDGRMQRELILFPVNFNEEYVRVFQLKDMEFVN